MTKMTAYKTYDNTNVVLEFDKYEQREHSLSVLEATNNI